MRVTTAMLASLSLVLAACGGRNLEPSSKEARVRNQPPATCTQEDFNRCPELQPMRCADGTEPVIDYSSDCCPHFTCQPLCEPTEPCPMWPAPVCPPGTQLVIATATDCCPAYRCEPDAQCEGREAPCPLAMPYCGPGVEPIIVGQTDACCPIYQCPPCVLGSDEPYDPTFCGCTYPACAPGERLECRGDGICGYPCECLPATGQCLTDADCAWDCQPGMDCGPPLRCDLSQCLPPEGCDPATGQPCADGCFGVCVGYVQDGCRSDSECPVGQRCDLQCMGWGCVPASGGDVPGEPCTCPPGDFTCTCSPDGSCQGEECRGQCVPEYPYFCDEPPPPGACPVMPMPCTDPIQTGIDPNTCCPIFECATCVPKGVPCAMPDCQGAIQVGTDPNCCPIFCCPDASGSCPLPPPACASDRDCAAGETCVNGLCIGEEPPTTRCSADADCGAGQACVNGVCAWLTGA